MKRKDVKIGKAPTPPPPMLWSIRIERDFEDYWQGAGAWGEWPLVVKGMGDTPHAAFDDAIEQGALSGKLCERMIDDLEAALASEKWVPSEDISPLG